MGRRLAAPDPVDARLPRWLSARGWTRQHDAPEDLGLRRAAWQGRASARDQVKAYAGRVVRFPRVLSVFFVGGPDDFLIHVACTSSAELRDFV
ncbi:Lrp/AsnC ligand binding domain-containing protein [Streptomyces albipurpureus]|uniref:Lrp/AsnC ligand binding domain-containing protein n=1 Tax=Streptomyces albipurpureus TaxID=2897419 RepID=UPI003CE537B7